MAVDASTRKGRPTSRWGTVRVRTTFAAVVVVGLALLAGTLGLVQTLRGTLTDDLRTAVERRSSELAAVVETGEVPPLAVTEADEEFVQIVVGGVVVASSQNVEGLAPIAVAPADGSTTIDVPIGDEAFVVAAGRADSGVRTLTVVVGQSLDEVDDATEAVVELLSLGGPLLLALVGFTTWNVAGRALAPVDAIRGEVEEISLAELHRRVPEPAAKDEVARLAETMNRMLGRLEDGQHRQRRFVADASHELRSPLASIRQQVEVARAHPDRSSLSDVSDAVLAETERMQHLVDDLLLLARVDERSLELHDSVIDLDDVVFDEARRLRDRTDLRIDTRAVSAGRVRGDERSLRRMLRNLGDNAARHAAATIAFGLENQDGIVVVTVDDDGPGIPIPERERVLERFVRLDEGRARDQGGAGLGLPIVAELVAAHGGRLLIGDCGLGGTRVRIGLPAHPADDHPTGGS